MKHVLYIHGANATPASFAYFKTQFPDHTVTDMEYDASEPLINIIDQASKLLADGVHIIGHSLGGIIAVALAQRHPTKVEGVVSMSTPFGGSETASRLRMFLPFNQFLLNVCAQNSLLSKIVKTGVPVPMMKFITTAGRNPFESKPNDGVVTLESQEALATSFTEWVPFNHFEVLLDEKTAHKIKAFIF